jgi:mannose-6-phosphate isomerase-like protein (cupin superfamily)
MASFAKLLDSGFRDGEEIRVLVNIPGFSLTHIWFKKDFPLPLHSHDADCLYYIVAGSIKMGTQVLGPRDCFFIPEDAPYTYRPGPDGVELLEFRHKTQFNYVNHVHGAGFWAKAIDTSKANREAWKTEKMPALNT